MSAGKGDKPRNCFSKQFKDNYDQIKWGEDPKDNKFKQKLDDALKKYPEVAEQFAKRTKKMNPTVKNNFIGI